MAGAFNGYSAIWSMWQIHSTGRALYIHLGAMINSVASGTVRGEPFNTDHLETLYNMVRNAQVQVEDVIANSTIADVKRLAEAIEGDGTADYIADVQDWRTDTAQLVADVEVLYPRGENQFPVPAVDLTQGQLSALETRLIAIKAASE